MMILLILLVSVLASCSDVRRHRYEEYDPCGGACPMNPVFDGACVADHCDTSTDVCVPDRQPERAVCLFGLCDVDGICRECLTDDDCTGEPCRIPRCLNHGCALQIAIAGSACDGGVCMANGMCE